MSDERCTDPVRNALIGAAAEVAGYLRRHRAPPIWWHVIDVIHKRAGSVWDETTEDNGVYVCPGCGFSVEDGPCDNAIIEADVTEAVRVMEGEAQR